MLYPVSYKPEGGLQTMTSAEFETVANHVLEYFATVDGPGNIYNTNPGNGTLIGSITDTSYGGNVGESNVTVVSNIFNVYQDLTTPTIVNDMPAVLVYDTNRSALRLTATSEIDEFAANILNYGVNNEGPGSYVISTTTPVGGTWSAIGTFNNVVSNVTPTVSYTLYKKIAGNTYTLSRPVKVSTAGNKVDIQRLTNTELNYLATRVRKKIIDTGIGQYVLQETAPVEGTWVEKGTLIDTRPTLTSTSYDTDYTSVSETNYEVVISYTGAAYTGDYVGDSGGTYLGGAPASYLGPVVYTGDNAAFFSTSGPVYSGIDNYTSDTSWGAPVAYDSVASPTVYTLENGVPGPGAFLGYFTGSYQRTYTGEITYFRDLDYAGSVFDSTVYLATWDAIYTGPGGDYATFRPFVVLYYVSSYTGTETYFSGAPLLYSGPTVNYDSSKYFTGTKFDYYTGDATYTLDIYTGIAGYVGTSVFSNPDGIGYTSTPIYSGPAGFTNTDGISFVGSVPTNYTGPATFSSAFDSTFLAVALYTGTYDTEYTLTQTFTSPNYSGPVTYTGDNAVSFNTPGPTYSGPVTYTGDNAVSFNTPGPTYSGPVAYTGDDAAFFTTPGPTYSGPVAYTGDDAALFQNISLYTGVDNYTNEDSSPYLAPPYYTGSVTYTGDNAAFFTTPGTTYSGPVIYTGDDAAFFTTPGTTYSGPAAFTVPGGEFFDTSYEVVNTFLGPFFQGWYGGTGPLYGGLYDSSIYYVTSYSSIVFYTQEDSAFFNSNEVSYTGTISIEWATTYADANYVYITTPYYTGTLPVEYTSVPAYSGPSPFTNPDGTTFTGTLTYSGPSPFTNPDGTTFTGLGETYSGTMVWINPGPVYTTQGTIYSGPASFTNPDGTTFASTLTYSGPQAFTNPDGTTFASTLTYSGPSPFTNPDGTTFASTLTYSGPQAFTNPNATVFTSSYQLDLLYSSSFDGVLYTGPSGYTGPSAPNLYLTTYGLETINNPNSPEVYSDPTETNTYTGISTETVTTKKLWRRIA